MSYLPEYGRLLLKHSVYKGELTGCKGFKLCYGVMLVLHMSGTVDFFLIMVDYVHGFDFFHGVILFCQT
jgi:hypothetical protein